MKNLKLMALAAMLCLGTVNVAAQDEEELDESFIFVDKEGNEIADGSTVTFVGKPHPFTGKVSQVDVEVSVKNTLPSAEYCSLHIVTKSLPSGSIKSCFPINCTSNIPADFESDSGSLFSGETRGLITEWIVEDGNYGTATLTLQLRHMEKFVTPTTPPTTTYIPVGEGPTINVNLIYADPAAIDGIEGNDNTRIVARYNANGQIVKSPVKGVNILKLSNGKVVKVIEK